MIDDALLASFTGELEALRRHGAEFARLYPDIASELDVDGRRSRDGNVERIVQSTASSPPVCVRSSKPTQRSFPARCST